MDVLKFFYKVPFKFTEWKLIKFQNINMLILQFLKPSRFLHKRFFYMHHNVFLYTCRRVKESSYEKLREKSNSFTHYRLELPDEILARAKYRNYNSRSYSFKQATV